MYRFHPFSSALFHKQNSPPVKLKINSRDGNLLRHGTAPARGTARYGTCCAVPYRKREFFYGTARHMPPGTAARYFFRVFSYFYQTFYLVASIFKAQFFSFHGTDHFLQLGHVRKVPIKWRNRPPNLILREMTSIARFWRV